MYSLLLALALTAPPAADTVAVEATLPEVSVLAARHATPPAEAPARVTLLGRRSIASSGSRSVAELLDARTPTFVRRYGPAGLASISLRGTGAAQTLVLLDGHRIGDPQLGQVDLSLLPTILLERVEILHGAGSALHGSDAIGGVVDLRTLSGATTGAELASTIGAFGELGASGRATHAQGAVRGVVAAEVRRSDGDFPYADRHTGSTIRRTGADASLGSLFGRVEADLGSTTVAAALWTGAADRGIPGSVGAPVEARQQDRHVRAWGSVAHPLAGGSVRAAGLVQRASLRYGDDEGRTVLASSEVELRAAVGRWVIASGVSLGLASGSHPRLDSEAHESRIGLFAAATGDFGRLLLYPAIRADFDPAGTGSMGQSAVLSPRMGINWQPIGALPLRLKAGAGSAFRAPTFNDRFWKYAGTDVGGDPDLRPESGWTADTGALLELTAVSLEVSLYGSWLRDQIIWRPGPGGLFVPVNVGRTRTRGIEVSAESRPLRLGSVEIEGGVTYALTDARDRSDPESSSFDRQLRYVPRHLAKSHASGRLDVGRETVVLLGMAATYVSARPVRVDGSLDEPGYFLATTRLGLTRRVGASTITGVLTLENTLDVDYSVIRGYPMPPRHARLEIHLRI